MNCRDVMKQAVETLSPDDMVEAAAIRMRNANIGFLPVCDAGGRVIGVVTDRDLVVRVVANDLDPVETPVEDVMTADVVTCRPEDPLEVAETKMGRNEISRIVCVDRDGALAGVISLSDLAQADEAARVGRTLREVTEREAPAP